MHKFSYTIGDGVNAQFEIAHNLGTMNIVTSLRTNSTPSEIISTDVLIIDENTVRLVFSVAPAESALVLTIIG